MSVEQGNSYAPERNTPLKKNEVRWNGKTLRVPWLGYDRVSVDFSATGDQIYSVDQQDQKWIQVGTYGSLKRAKARVRLELDRDSQRHNGGISKDGAIVLLATELQQAMKYGVLPQSPEKYAEKGKAHVAFGPAVEIDEDYDLKGTKNKIGVWRPVKEFGFEKNARHILEKTDRTMERIIAEDRLQELSKKLSDLA